jgi:hypothetical protein
MGMFDTVRCDYPLPIEGANTLAYQTKSFMAPSLDNYIIESDGRLIRVDSDTTTTVNMADFIGEVRFYTSWKAKSIDWLEWSAYFVRGSLRELHLIRQTDALLHEK